MPAGELRPNATEDEPKAFKRTVVEFILNLFRTVDGFRERARTGTTANVV
jgi:hypothetical protein